MPKDQTQQQEATPNLPTEEELRHKIHMEMLSKSSSAKDCGELTVIPLGHAVTVAVQLIHHYTTKRELEAKISAYDLELIFGMDTSESADYKRGFYDAMEKYDAALNNIQAQLKAQKEQENK